MKLRPPKDRKATERKRSEGVIGKAHQYARICKGDIAVFICNEDGKCKAYQSSNRKTWGTFFEQLQKNEQPWIVNIVPEDLDDNGRKKKKRKRSMPKKTVTSEKAENTSLQLPKFPLIQSESEEWLLLDAVTDSSEHTGLRPGRMALDIPGKISLILGAVSPIVDVLLYFPEPPPIE